MQTTVTSAEVITAFPSTDSYSFKGVFKALASVAEAAGNLCNKSPGRAKRLSDSSADTNTVPAPDTTRQGEHGVRRTEGDGLKHICCRCWSAQTDGIHSISGCCCRERRRRGRWGRGDIYSSFCRPVSKTKQEERLEVQQPQTGQLASLGSFQSGLYLIFPSGI